jgi:large subunit ribosomal protein L18
MSKLSRTESRRRVHRRIRKKVAGTATRPRLAVHYSNQHIYAQIIDDHAGRTICAASTLDKEVEKPASNVASATKVGSLIASRAKDGGVGAVVFDRGGHLYHGKIKALADAAREGGLEF